MVRAGLLVAGSVLTLVSAFILTFAVHWFPASMLVLGVGTMVGSWFPEKGAEPAGGASPSNGLGPRLDELDRLRANGTLTAAEHRRKRKDLIDAWGRPPAH